MPPEEEKRKAGDSREHSGIKSTVARLSAKGLKTGKDPDESGERHPDARSSADPGPPALPLADDQPDAQVLGTAEQSTIEYEAPPHDEHDDTAEYFVDGILTAHYTKELSREANHDDFQQLLEEFHDEMETSACFGTECTSGAPSSRVYSGTDTGGAPSSRVSGAWSKADASVVIPGPWKKAECFYMHVFTGQCFRVREATDMLTHDELRLHAELVESAGRK